MYKKIVVGFDGSDRAKLAVDEAADLATAVGAQLNLVTAVNGKNRIHEIGESTDKQFLSDVEIARDRLVDLAGSMNHLDVRVTATTGAPAQVLVDEATRIDADLILVGNKNISSIMGSIAEGVAQKAPCAVLIAKTA